MMLKSPVFRLTCVLILLSLNLLLLAHLLGFFPDADKSALETRKSLCESLALQFSTAADAGEYQTIQQTLRVLVDRNDEILSAAIRTTGGKLIAVAGEHLAFWKAPKDGKSSPTEVQVPIFLNKKHWATVEIRFTPLWTNQLATGSFNSFAALLVFFGLGGSLCFFFVIKRTLRELDPSAVIPERVQRAFDVLQEGVLILDEKEHIVLANIAFASLFGKSSSEMIGLKGSELGWLNYDGRQKSDQLPWFKALKDGKEHLGTLLTLRSRHSGKIKLTVNVAVVTDAGGKVRGTLSTFDDITQLEEKNFELGHTIEKLQLANDEIQQKSQELKFLAERDPLTQCLNRRSMSLRYGAMFSKAVRDGTPLSCMMADIDLFKSVNDRYGHAVGDEVIKAVADVLIASTRESDLVGRYGGEEFCVILYDLTRAKTADVAERIRSAIESKMCAGIKITLSLGVSFLDAGTAGPDELINQADKALYAAKKSGRNRVVLWGCDVDPSTGNDSASGDRADAPSAEEGADPDTDPSYLQRRVRQLEGQLEKRTLELRHFEMYDSHTGLPTRALFEDRIGREIARCKRQNSLMAVLSMNIDAVKRIQEAFGYNAAEQMVRDCGQRLIRVLREKIDTVAAIQDHPGTATVSLINPAEFGILLSDIAQVDHVTWVMKRMLDTFEKPFLIKDNEIHASACFGVSIYPHDGKTVEELCCSAINACNHARKLSGPERYLFSSRRLNAMAVEQLNIENDLHDALQNEEFQIYYQPKVSARNGQTIGYEALIRWQHKDLGIVLPGQFIPVAEQSGLINRIGDWVIYNACRQFRKWNEMGLDVGSIAINVSGAQLRQEDLANRLESVLNEFSIDPRLIEIELTESSLIDTHDQSLANLRRFKEKGLRITLDDFGTGYSSLSYLHKMPLSGLKIDRSFVADIGKDENANKLIACIVAIAHELGLEVTAEGVEQKRQVDYLTEAGCEYLQGYYFSAPVPQEDVAQNERSQPMVLAG
jgi:diguanylate cyclase (GGDEF)-like protein/PAS domain S-box-containing protein